MVRVVGEGLMINFFLVLIPNSKNCAILSESEYVKNQIL